MKSLSKDFHISRSARRRLRPVRRWFVPVIEPLERRLPLAIFFVDSALDLRDDHPGDGVCQSIDPATGTPLINPTTGQPFCTLRASINEANALADVDPSTGLLVADEIVLKQGVYMLSQPAARSNSLGLNSEVTLRADSASGASASNTIIDGGSRGSVFEIAGYIPRPGLPGQPNQPDKIEIAGVTIRNGSAPFGGGIITRPGLAGTTLNLVLNDCTVDGNHASNDGGGMFVGAGTVTIRGCTFSHNLAGRDGGGLFSHSENKTEADFSTNPPTITVTPSLGVLNSTFSQNAAVHGGGISYGHSPEVLAGGTGGSIGLTHVTLVGNLAAAAGGGLAGNAAGESLFQNTIIAGNSGGNCSGAVIAPDSHHSLEDAHDCGLNPANNNLVDTEPELSPFLSDNGGPTRTHVILAGSSATDAGDDAAAAAAGLLTDQRGPGFQRKFGSHVDIGSYELQIDNRAPLAQDDRFVVAPEIQGWRFHVLANDSDPDSDALTIDSFTQGINGGTVRFFPDEPAALFYTPVITPGSPRVDQFEYTISDGRGGSDTATVFVTKNQKPFGSIECCTRPHGSTGAFTISAPGLWEDVHDADGDPLTLRLGQLPQHGTLTLGLDSGGRPDGSFTYTPTSPDGRIEADFFSYVLNDGFEDSYPIPVGIRAPNSPPILVDDFASFPHGLDSPIFFGRYYDADGDGAVSATVVEQPFFGEVSLFINDGVVAISYVPHAGDLRGSDAFSYRINDGYADSNVARFEIRVPNAEPVARDISTGRGFSDDISHEIEHSLLGPSGSTEVRDNLLTYNLESTGLASDSDGDPLTAFLDGNPATIEDSRPKHGTVSLSPEGEFVYTPNPGYEVWGTDRFGYRVWDGHDASNVAYVTIRQSLGEMIFGSDSFSVARGGALRINPSQLVANDRFQSGLPAAFFAQYVKIVSWHLSAGNQFEVIGEHVVRAADNFGVCHRVGDLECGTAFRYGAGEFIIHVGGNYPTETYYLGYVVEYPGPGLDPNILVDGTDPRRALRNWGFVLIDETESPESDSDGVPDVTESFVPYADGDFNGDGVNDRIQFTGDGNGDGILDSQQPDVASLPTVPHASNLNEADFVTLVAAPGTQLFNVESILVPSPETFPGIAFFPIGFYRFQVMDLLPGEATMVTMYPPPGSILNTYWKFGLEWDDDPSTTLNELFTEHWYQFLYDGTTGAELVNDDDGDPDTDRIVLHFVDGKRGDNREFPVDFTQITIAGLLTPGIIADPGGPAFWLPNPIAGHDSYITDEDQTLGIAAPGLLASDFSPTSAPLSAFLVGGTAHGVLTLQPDGSFTYVPDANFNGTDSFAYKASDGRLESEIALVTITVIPVNDAPVASASGPPGGLRGQTLSFTLGASDVEPDDQAAGFAYQIDWNGDGTVDQFVTGPSGTQVEHVFGQAGSFIVRIIAADQHGAVSNVVTLPIVIAVPPPAIESVTINDGHAQRSMLTTLAVNFDSLVTIDSGAFELWQQGTNKPLKLNLALSEQSGRTLARLTFKGPHVVGGSLPDGNYRLVIRGDKIRDAAGRLLDGDGDGSAGGNRVDEFFRRFGDTDGDDDVDLVDADVFGRAFGKRSHQPGYLWYLDYNANGRIWVEDLALFFLNYGCRPRRQ